MRARALGTFAAWLAATGFAVAVSWYGLRPVLDTAAPDRAAPLSIDHLRELSPAPAPSVTPARAATPPRARPPAPSGPSAPSGPGGGPSGLRPAAPHSTVPVVVDGWTVVTAADGTSAYLRTFQSRGGQVAARVAPGVAALVSATPLPGYTVRAQNASPDRLVVQFWTAAGQMSTVDVMWFEGGPWFSITEQ